MKRNKDNLIIITDDVNWKKFSQYDYLQVYVTDKIKTVFELLNTSNKDVFTCIDLYLQSNLCRAVDFNVPSKMMLQPVQIAKIVTDNCTVENDEQYDFSVLHWMAEIYRCFVTDFNVLSSEAFRIIDSKSLYRLYSPLHETSITNGVSKLLERSTANGKSDKF